MKELVEAVADSIEAELDLGTVQRHSPIWRDPAGGPMVYVFWTNESIGSYRTTGSREDLIELVIEVVEPVDQSDLQRDEEAELEFSDKLKALRQWAFAHQAFPGVAHGFNLVGLSSPDDVRRELMVRYGRATCLASVNVEYS